METNTTTGAAAVRRLGREDAEVEVAGADYGK
jgi:hypothetical protein